MNKRQKIEGTKLNKCVRLVLPMCDINFSILPKNFTNGYISDNNKAIIVFDKKYILPETDNFEIFLLHLCENKNFKLKTEDEDEIVVYFNIPSIWLDDLKLFKIGAYSKFSNDYKKKLVQYFGNRSIKDTYHANVYNAIYPQDFKRKQIAERLSTKNSIVDYRDIVEVLEVPDLFKETFRPITQLQETNINNI